MKACIPCSRRHVRCDRRRPICTRCAKAKSRQRCTYSSTRFRQSRLSIAAATERSTPPRHQPDSEAQNLDPPATPDLAGLSATPQGLPPTRNQFPLPLHDSSGQDVVDLLAVQPSPSDLPSSTYAEEHPNGPKSRRLSISEGEADFFQCYLEHAGVWLDVVSPNQAFSQSVPRLALQNPVLYYSCLAYAAHVLYLWGRTDRVKPDYYHNQAISLLIPLLDAKSQPQASTEDLLATIVILRMSEQFSEPAEDAQCHLNGAFSLLTSSRSKWRPDRVDVKGIAFWTFVRQTLRMCFLFEQECRFDLGIVDCSNMLSPARDEVWTNRMTYLLAKACNLCWGPDCTSVLRGRYLDVLEEDINSWREALPDTFKPWYYHQAHTEPFPTIRYLSRWHGLAWQQYYTAKTMLAVYRHRPQALDSYRDINTHVNSTILVAARLTCGVVLSDTDVGSGINGAHLAYWCGQFFMGRDEQSALLKWLERFMQNIKWPNRTCVVRLQKLWGIPDHGSSPPIV
ncbi:uncharacterized protein BJX67DRAFT_377756 [Aspergillus lucknowensis]|uniref:Zn(2)-C6 fungal-type domain-containing protein n=1 Tax=Aspergillus lucknowensis TaxID=176173 RepID=A0ABR4M3J7_9EURO